MTVKTWNIEAMTGYKPITTFYEDFSIAEKWGESAIRETYTRAMQTWRFDYKYLTELVMALNWKIWEHHTTNDAFARVYNELWQEADNFAYENLQGEELKYYFSTTD